jgi:hypothetical protein
MDKERPFQLDFIITCIIIVCTAIICFQKGGFIGPEARQQFLCVIRVHLPARALHGRRVRVPKK